MTDQERKAYLKEPYARLLIPNEDGTYSAEILEFPGCFAEGDTADEAMRNLEAAAESWIDASLAQGQEIPEPAANQGYGGKVALRLPRSLHRQAARLAERDGTSLNQFLATAVAYRVGAEDMYSRLVEQYEQRMAKATPPFMLVVRDWRTTMPESRSPFLVSSAGITMTNLLAKTQPETSLLPAGKQWAEGVFANV